MATISCKSRKQILADVIHPNVLFRAKEVISEEDIAIPETCFSSHVYTTYHNQDTRSGSEDSSPLPNETSEEVNDSTNGEDCVEECLLDHDGKDENAFEFLQSSSQSPSTRKRNKMNCQVYLRRRSILIVGDMACGKTSLMTTYCKDKFSDVYTPTILHCWESDAKVSGRTIPLQLVDVPGRYDYKPIRCAIYKNVDVAIVCYSAGDVESFEHIRTHWLPELKECAPKCPIVLAETKRDIRDEFEDAKKSLDGKMRSERKIGQDIVSQEAGPTLAKEVGAQGFYSCSAKFRIGTRSLLQEATFVALKKSRKKRTS